MSRQIKFSLVYRDMWQSSGKYVPRVDQLLKVAPHIIEMGCFARVETNGGGFEQVNLLFGENPNKAVRQWTKPFHDAGIQTHMLERSLNGLRMSPVPADVRKLNFKVKKLQGTDIARSFCGLNDERNLLDSIKYAKEGGMIAQAALSLTYSKIHTPKYFINLADTLIKGGADEICLKDMAGIARPAWLGEIVEGIKAKYPDIVMTYHGHSGPGFSMATILEVARAGVEYIDVAMEPISWGTGHADVLAVQAMLKDAGFDVPDINMEAYMKVRSLSKEFMDDFLGYWMDPKNREMNSLLIGPGLPGGMMGSMMADLRQNLESLNKWLVKNGKPEMTQDDLLIRLFDEVEYVWPRVGNPPLVTPFSQYVKNLSLMNVMQMIKGRERWSMIADDIWGMILGQSGKLPGTVAPELVALAKEEGREFYTGNPQTPYPDALDKFRAEMDKNGWDYGQDDEELLELAMHPEQYRKFKSGEAKKSFEKELAELKAKKENVCTPAAASGVAFDMTPKTMTVDVNGEKYAVTVSFDGAGTAASSAAVAPVVAPVATPSASAEKQTIISPLEGTWYLTKDASEKALKAGDVVKKGDLLGYVEAMKTFNAIKSDKDGVITEILPSQSAISEDDVIVSLG